MASSNSTQSITNVDISKIRPSNNSVSVTPYTLRSGVLVKNKDALENPIFWHKFTVNNSKDLSRDLILKIILDHAHPCDLIPVYFHRENKSASFLARNCGAAIEKLCKDNLLVQNPFIKDSPMCIILRFSNTNDVKIDVSKNINKVLRKKTNLVNLSVDLDNFVQNKELMEYCPLSQPKLMSYVLHLSRPSKPKSFVLSNNEIKNLSPVEALWGLNVVGLDLRNNLLADLNVLEPLRQLKITELWLDGNPLCALYDEHTYAQRVKEYCPLIEKLDGITLKQNGFPSIRRNFLCDTSGYDLVDRFLEYYFTAYDSSNRTGLQNLYHERAMFSLTADYHAMQLSSPSSKLKRYMYHGRNLLQIADLKKVELNLKQGTDAITSLFNAFPPTEHDPYSFTVDLVYFTDSCAVIVITGVCKELPETILDVERILGFNRCFTLECKNNEYCIVNEQLHLYNALTSQQARSFKQGKPARFESLQPAGTQREKKQAVNAVMMITNLTAEWAQKCLHECNYNVKNALSLFVDLYKIDKIPPSGFSQSTKS